MQRIQVSMNEQSLSIVLTGPIDAESVQDLGHEIELGFEYYKFNEITLKLNSPGGDFNAMRSLMEQIKCYRRKNLPIHVHAGQMCASAAALVLANAHWGTRSVQMDTQLLFHWSRTSMASGMVLTGELAAHLARNLSAHDQVIMSQLVHSLCAGAGGGSALVHLLEARLHVLLKNWPQQEAAMHFDSKENSVKKLAWVRDLQRSLMRWKAQPDPVKKVSALTQYLQDRFERDSMMDLRQAYCLCLIDKINGLFPIQGTTPASDVEHDSDDAGERVVERLVAQ
ncbi:MAG: ATP-dependent Clp protease proteolytic subunit [Rhodoferax sp.]|uniref:ATP-dependent Clp protease proteolytic subunit n=1 Tax=Rhodoferax sp. TaxID=50421 RepID=UPI001B783916|nr:ATP-dependent Clp protease proteolytic subunit [Rhodoferax sp.]MBP9906278.1 ATP-dependent Clp protease proteolytic subunit [Rhodoferax sp.]